MDRIAQLRKFIEGAHDQPFPRYALALELKGQGDAEGAARELQALLDRSPDYLAAYLQLGMLLAALGSAQGARATLAQGQELARRKGDSHTLSELTSALEGIA
jgi:thioredoxin-like negative regulator of GroEL